MFLTILKEYWRQIIYVLVVAFVLAWVYSKGYDSAYQNRTSYYEGIRAAEMAKLNSKIDNLENLSNELATQGAISQNKITRDLNNVVKNLPKSVPFIVKNGECIPSENFIDTFNSIITRGNSK
jgi:hypothetical protein